MGADPRSRYRDARRLTVAGPAGEVWTMLAPRVAREPATNGTYEIRSGDRLDLLAHVGFGDSTQWWRLADANPWPDADRLERAGTIIRLPNE